MSYKKYSYFEVQGSYNQPLTLVVNHLKTFLSRVGHLEYSYSHGLVITTLGLQVVSPKDMDPLI